MYIFERTALVFELANNAAEDGSYFIRDMHVMAHNYEIVFFYSLSYRNVRGCKVVAILFLYRKRRELRRMRCMLCGHDSPLIQQPRGVNLFTMRGSREKLSWTRLVKENISDVQGPSIFRELVQAVCFLGVARLYTRMWTGEHSHILHSHMCTKTTFPQCVFTTSTLPASLRFHAL